MALYETSLVTRAMVSGIRIQLRCHITHEVLEDLERLLARRPPREPDEGDLVRQAKLVVRSSCRAYEPEILGAQPGLLGDELA